jgi:hypothetical protein
VSAAQRRALRPVILNRVVAELVQPLMLARAADPMRGIATSSRGTFTGRRYLISVSILNIGRYMLMMITPTIRPTPIIMIGSMIEVSAWIDASTSSS